MVVSTSTAESLTTTAEVNFKSGEQKSTFYLVEPQPSPQGDIKQDGATYLKGKITMTPDQASRGMAFPYLNISGTFFRETNEGPAFVMPTPLSGQVNILAPLKYSVNLPSITPKR